MRRICPQNGITLIALIITIIVMLILVGVTINVVLNGGLFTQAQEAAKNTQKEAEREQLLSALVAAIGTDGKVDFSKLVLPEGWTGSNGTYISPEGNVYNVDKKGNITDGTDEGNNVVYEYTLAEIIEIAKKSSIAMYGNESEEEDYVEGEPYGIEIGIPFSEFWKEGTPDSVKNGTKSGEYYKYEVTVENLPYIDIGDGSPDGDRGLLFVGLGPENTGIDTTENWIMVGAIGLTSKDDPKQIKIKIGAVEPEPEIPEPEFNGFTLGDLVDAGTETIGDDNKTYFDMPVAKFNEIIGQDITTLEDYIYIGDGISYNLGKGTEYDDGGAIRVLSTSTDPYFHDLMTNMLYVTIGFKMNITEDNDKRMELNNSDEGFKYYAETEFPEDGENIVICMGLIINKETNEKIIRLAVSDSGDGPTFTKEEISENALNATLKLLNNKKLIKLVERYSNN